MGKKPNRTRGEKLNKGLDPSQFRICVPNNCQLLGPWNDPDSWDEYLRDLLDLGKDQKVPQVSSCCTCDCRKGRELTGPVALKHACRVHDKIHRQILSLDQVSAVDVGFAVAERQAMFEPFLAIRIHVNKKRSAQQLEHLGLASFSDPRYVDRNGLSFPDESDVGVASETECCEQCRLQTRYLELQKVLQKYFPIHEEDRSDVGPRARWPVRNWSLDRYPVHGIRQADLSIFCKPDTGPSAPSDIRLCICGVPIDIINAEYTPSIAHPGGDAESGIFAEESKNSIELSDEELRLIGRGRANPLVGGISVGTVTGQAGTLGTIVWDCLDGTACVLSNWHVLAGTPSAQVGQPTYQPAIFDGGTDKDVIARLKRWRLDETGDAAIAELTGTRHYAAGEVLGFWHPISGTLQPRLNMEVRKWGRTTGFTQGFVDGIHLATNIDYGNEVVRSFRNQFHIAPLFRGEDVSQVGDSGSLVVTSFRPLEQARNLLDFCDWLRTVCGIRARELCQTIEKQVAVWKEVCEQLESCDQVCAVVKNITFESVCENPASSKELCGKLQTTAAVVQTQCEETASILKALEAAEAELKKIFEEFCSPKESIQNKLNILGLHFVARGEML